MSASELEKDDPLIDLYTHPNNDNRVWVGNLDPRVTEFELIKLFKNAGKIDKLEYLFHKIGPQAGQPRGYAFLTFAKHDEAVKARREFDGKLLLGRTLLVKPARSVSKEDLVGSKANQITIPALSGAKETKNHKLNLEQQIKAIESKLKTMENSQATLPQVPANFISPLSRVAVRPAAQPYQSSRSARTRGGTRPYRRGGVCRDRRK